MPKPPMTIDELLASDDPEDEAFLEEIFQTDTYNDPDDEEEFWDAEDQSEGDLDCERDA